MNNEIQDYGDASAEAHHNKVLLNVVLNQIDEMADEVHAYNRKPNKKLASDILLSAVCNGEGIREIVFQVLSNLDDISKRLEQLERQRVTKGGVKRGKE